MKLHTVVLTGTCLLALAPQAMAGVVTGYLSAPTANSVNWSAAATAYGYSINTDVNFNAMVTGTINSNFYSASNGVTIANNAGASIASSCCGLNGYGNTSTGEGPWTPSNLIYVPANNFGDSNSKSISFSFASPVTGAGIFLVDFGGFEAWTISAYDASNNLLGSFNSVTGYNFQQKLGGDHYKYFMGLLDSTAEIRKVTFSRPGNQYTGDIVGLDDFRFAVMAPPTPAPEPMTLAIFGTGLFGLGLIRNRRMA